MTRPRNSPKRRQTLVFRTYTLLDELQASATEPMPVEKRDYQIGRMKKALESIERAPKPAIADWRMLSDAVNIVETLIEGGVAEDGTGLLHDAMAALAHAGRRSLETPGTPIRLDGPGLLAVRAVLESYEEILAAIPARVAIAAHRRTERRIQEIFSGKRRPHDVEVLAI